MDIDLIVKISARAWALNILALVSSGTAARQAALVTETGAGRTALVQSLKHLIDLGLLERNPGHGHPLRPEFRLTEEGHALGAAAQRIHAQGLVNTELKLLRRAWTLPVLAATREPRYFAQIKREVRPITDRSLAQSLTLAEENQWIARKVDLQQRPLRPTYQAVNTGADIAGEIARAF